MFDLNNADFDVSVYAVGTIIHFKAVSLKE